jgi:UDP-N-acetylmuramoylalanine--D-glutamate ligase
MTVTYCTDIANTGGLGIEDGWIVAENVERLELVGGGLAETDLRDRIMPVDELQIPGWHNVSNAMAAIAVGLLFGVRPKAIRRAAAGFTGVEHRLEIVTTVDRVRFVNDSQGTQPDAVVAALRSFDPPIVLIAGGRDKGVDLGDLPRVVAERATVVVTIGESGSRLGESFSQAGFDGPVAPADSMDDAVRLAAAFASDLLREGPNDAVATVLLSPAAASFDMFTDYEARGRAFKAAVARLEEERR